MDLLPIGSKIEIHRLAPAMGSWPRYQGRKGTIVSVNKETFSDGSIYVEYGVSFKANIEERRITKTETDAWFKPSEVRLVSNVFVLNMGFSA